MADQATGTAIVSKQIVDMPFAMSFQQFTLWTALDLLALLQAETHANSCTQSLCARLLPKLHAVAEECSGEICTITP
jgi:hypothetical protein